MASSTSTSPLALPIFRAVWIASLVSNFGGLIQSVGASWMMTSLGGSPQMVALVQTSTSLPIMLLSLLGGAIADNLDRRRVMLVAQIFMLLVSLILAVGSWTGFLSPWVLLASTFLIGCGTAINGPAWLASVGDMVPRSALPNAIALNSMGFNIARSAGPAIGGLIVAVAGAATAFLANAVSYIGLIGVLARWKPDVPTRALPPESLRAAIGAGVRYVAMSPAIRQVMLRAFLFATAGSAVSAMMPLVARDLLKGGPLTYGFLLGSFGIGAVGGALFIGKLRRHVSTEVMIAIAAGAMTIGEAATGLSTFLGPTICALALAGAGWVIALSTFNISVQMASPRWVVARALAICQMAVFGGMATGSWLCGVIADAHGPILALQIAALVQVVGILVGWHRPLTAISDANLTPQGWWKEPDIALSIEPRSGPIIIEVEHRVPLENVPHYLAAMGERRRIRRRDGARGWSLMRDLGSSELWIERYHVATWLDYVRHNQRRTQADTANSELLASLTTPGSRSIVHRRIERQTGSLPASLQTDDEIREPMTDPTRSS